MCDYLFSSRKRMAVGHISMLAYLSACRCCVECVCGRCSEHTLNCRPFSIQTGFCRHNYAINVCITHNENCRCHWSSYVRAYRIISIAECKTISHSHTRTGYVLWDIFAFYPPFTSNPNPFVLLVQNGKFCNNSHYLDARANVCESVAVTSAIHFARVTSLASNFCIDFKIHSCHTSPKHDRNTTKKQIRRWLIFRLLSHCMLCGDHASRSAKAGTEQKKTVGNVPFDKTAFHRALKRNSVQNENTSFGGAVGSESYLAL